MDNSGGVDLIVDALIGYSLTGDPAEPFACLIRWANAQPAPVLSLDTPSGLDVTTGVPARPCVRATATLTLALPKTGLPGAREAGHLYLADISVPPLLYRRWPSRSATCSATPRLSRWSLMKPRKPAENDHRNSSFGRAGALRRHR
jgi:hypothetical protein